MNARTQAFVLLLFGGALVRLATGDGLLRYVRPVARPWVLLAGIGFVALALWGLINSIRGRAAEGEPQSEAETDHDGHGHGAVSRASWLVLAPVVAILVVAPPALGAYSAARVPATVARPSDPTFPALAGRDPVPVSLIDFAARALWDDGRTLTGHTVRLTGFVLRTDAGGFVLTRLVITCCAADARPIDIGVQSGSPAPATDTWVTVTGTYAGVAPADATLPMITARAVTPIRAPANPYDD